MSTPGIGTGGRGGMGQGKRGGQDRGGGGHGDGAARGISGDRGDSGGTRGGRGGGGAIGGGGPRGGSQLAGGRGGPSGSTGAGGISPGNWRGGIGSGTNSGGGGASRGDAQPTGGRGGPGGSIGTGGIPLGNWRGGNGSGTSGRGGLPPGNWRGGIGSGANERGGMTGIGRGVDPNIPHPAAEGLTAAFEATKIADETKAAVATGAQKRQASTDSGSTGANLSTASAPADLQPSFGSNQARAPKRQKLDDETPDPKLLFPRTKEIEKRIIWDATERQAKVEEEAAERSRRFQEHLNALQQEDAQSWPEGSPDSRYASVMQENKAFLESLAARMEVVTNWIEEQARNYRGHSEGEHRAKYLDIIIEAMDDARVGLAKQWCTVMVCNAENQKHFAEEKQRGVIPTINYKRVHEAGMVVGGGGKMSTWSRHAPVYSGTFDLGLRTRNQRRFQLLRSLQGDSDVNIIEFDRTYSNDTSYHAVSKTRMEELRQHRELPEFVADPSSGGLLINRAALRKDPDRTSMLSSFATRYLSIFPADDTHKVITHFVGMRRPGGMENFQKQPLLYHVEGLWRSACAQLIHAYAGSLELSDARTHDYVDSLGVPTKPRMRSADVEDLALQFRKFLCKVASFAVEKAAGPHKITIIVDGIHEFEEGHPILHNDLKFIFTVNFLRTICDEANMGDLKDGLVLKYILLHPGFSSILKSPHPVERTIIMEPTKMRELMLDCGPN